MARRSLGPGFAVAIAAGILAWQAGVQADMPGSGTSPPPAFAGMPTPVVSGTSPFPAATGFSGAAPGAPFMPAGSGMPQSNPVASMPPALRPGFAPVPGTAPGTAFPGVPQPIATPATYSNQVHVKADAITYDRKTHVATARGNVDVTYQNSHINTEFLELDQGSNSVRTDQPFILTQTSPKGDQTVKGTSLTYGLKTHDATVSDVFMSVPAPVGGQTVFVSGKQLTSQGNKVYRFKDGTLTTCDLILLQETPHYHITSQSLILAPHNYAMGWNSWIYVNDRRFLWVPFFWLPLKKHKTSVSLGQNDVEGYFAKTTLGYQLDDHNSGTMFLNYMQKKGPGLGFSHTLSFIPHQLTNFDAYGLVQPDPDPSWQYIHGLDPANRRPFSDYMWHVRHQQRLLDTMSIDVSAEDYNLYNLQDAQGIIGSNLKVTPQLPGQTVDQALQGIDIREDHAANSLAVSDQRGGVTWDFSRQWRETRQSRGQSTPSFALGTPTSTQYGGDVSWSHDQTAVHLNSKYQAQTPYLYPTPAPSPTPQLPPGFEPLPAASATPQGVQSTTALSTTLHVDQKLPFDVQAGWDNNYTDNVTPGLAGSPTQKTRELEERLHLAKDLGWASATLDIDKLFVFAPFQYSFDPTSVASPSLLIARNFVEKLPELTVTTKPILPSLQPFTITAQAGRYFEFSSFESTTSVKANAAEKPFEAPISRLDTHADLSSDPHDLGLRTTLDFGGSNFDQRFYSTGDSAYATTIHSGLITQYTDWLKQTLTYNNVIPGGDAAISALATDNHVSTSPFKWDALSLQKATTLTGNEHFAFGSLVTWDNNSGYDYVNQRYNDYTTSLNVTPDPLIAMNLSTGYHFPEVPYFALDRATRADGTTTIGHWQALSSGVTLRSTAQAFGGQWGLDQIVPGQQIQTQLNWNPDTGKISSLTANVFASFGHRWQDHWQVYAGTSYDLSQIGDSGYSVAHPNHRTLHLLNAGISRDLHDFILSFDYVRQSATVQTYMLRLTMPAFGQNIINLSNNGSAPNITGGLSGAIVGAGTSPGFGTGP